jgi:hypothetical protein
MKKIIYLVLIVGLFACKKKNEITPPLPSFTMSNSYIYIGKPIDFTNTSSNSSTYEWISSDGITPLNTSTNYQYFSTKLGINQMTLKAYSAQRKYASEFTKSFEVYGGHFFTNNSKQYFNNHPFIVSKVIDSTGVYFHFNATNNTGNEELIIGKHFINLSLTDLNSSEFENLFSNRITTDTSTNNVVNLSLLGGNLSSHFTNINYDRFEIIYKKPYLNGYIVDATCYFGIGTMGTVSDAQITFYVER